MRFSEKPRTASSAAVLELRKALGKTQQEFAVEVVQTAIGTVAVWETTRPPAGDTLLKLAEVAWEHGQRLLSGRFTQLWLHETMPRLHTILQQGSLSEDGSSGYILFRYEDAKRKAMYAATLARWANELTEPQAAALNPEEQ